MSGPRVLIVNPPLAVEEAFIDAPHFSVLGPLSCAAALRDQGFEVTAADAFSSGLEAAALLRPPRRKFEAVVVGLPPFFKPHAKTAAASEFFGLLRKRFPKAKLIAADCYFGGMHYIEYEPPAFLKNYPEVDAVVKYEGEAALGRLLGDWPSQRPLSVSGRAAEVRPDDFPPPAWDLIDVPAYYRAQKAFFARLRRPPPYRKDLPTLPAVASRGCAHRCSFCTANPGEKTPAWRPHGLDYLRRAFRTLKERHGAGRVAILDGCANQDPARFEEILALLESLGLEADFPNGLRADLLSRDCLRRLKGLAESLTVSAESGDPEFLRRKIGKGLVAEDVERTAAWCRELGLPLSVHYLVGLPGETPEGVNKTLAHALKMKEEFGAVPLLQNFTPIPGTALHRECVQKGLLGEFDAENLHRHFQGTPALDTPELPRAKLARMTRAFQRRISAAALEKVIINLTYACDNACTFCAVGGREKVHGEPGRYARLLRDYRQRGAYLLDLDGGEPTLYPHLFHVVRLADALGYKKIALTTNGRRLADRAFASRLLLSGITDLMVSLHGPDSAVHESHTRRPGSFAQTVAGVKHAARLKPRGVSLAVNAVVTRANAPRAADFFRFVRDLGVETLNLQFVTPFGRAKNASHGDAADLCRALGPAVAEWGKVLRIQFVNALPCRLEGLFPETEPELGKHSREMVFVDSPARNLAAYLDAQRRKNSECAPCEHAVACGGHYVFEEERPPDEKD